MKKIIALVLLGISSQLSAQGAFGEVIGTVVEKKAPNDILYDAEVFILDGENRYRARTNTEGRFRISGIPAGTYFLNVKYMSDTMRNIAEVNISMEGIYNAGTLKFTSDYLEFEVITVSADNGNVKIDFSEVPVSKLSFKDIKNSPLKFDLNALVSSMSTDVRLTDDGELVFRGARKGDMIYIIDGVKVTESGSVPSCSIGYVMMYSGGLPAKYGDTTGGVVVMESKSYFDLYRSWVGEQIKSGKM